MISKRLDSLDAELFTEAIAFFAKIMNLHDSDIPFEVRTVDNIGRGNVAGCCTAHLTSEGEVRNIQIDIKNCVTVFGMIEALAHEMVHAEQFMTGKLNFKTEKKYLFGLFPVKRRVRMWKSIEIDGLDYYSNPGEVDAFLKQRAYTLEFLKTVENKMMPSNVFNHIMQDRTDKHDFTLSLGLDQGAETDSIDSYNNKGDHNV
jgi:hypothetical protein